MRKQPSLSTSPALIGAKVITVKRPKLEDSIVPNEQLFFGALGELVSVPRAEVQRRIESAAKEPVSRHKRYKISRRKEPTKALG